MEPNPSQSDGADEPPIRIINRPEHARVEGVRIENNVIAHHHQDDGPGKSAGIKLVVLEPRVPVTISNNQVQKRH